MNPNGQANTGALSGHGSGAGWARPEHTLRMFTITRAVVENEQTTMLYLTPGLGSAPGQFVMAWLPGHSERPFSIASDTAAEAVADGETGLAQGKFSISVAGVGESSKAIASLQPGAQLGIKGPLGKGFSLQGKHVIAIGGGYGLGPMTRVVADALAAGLQATLIVGARSKEFIILRSTIDRLVRERARVIITTNDGSEGIKGMVTDALAQLIADGVAAGGQDGHDGQDVMVYGCGPELMLKAIFDLCEQNSMSCQLSIERYMKCGIGLCGSCCLDTDGWRACKEGPVFSTEQLRRISEFGKYHRDATGQKIPY